MKKLIYLTIVMVILLLCGCNEKIDLDITPQVENIIEIDEKEQKETYLKIVTSNKLLYYMVKSIVRDKHNVEYMLKDEDEQWFFRYSNDSVENISKKDLFLYFGAGYEPWAMSFVEELKKDKVGIANISRGIRTLTLSKPRKYMETEIKENPYYWLNPSDYKIALLNTKNAIQEKDPKNRDFYEKNFVQEIKNIEKYEKEMKILAEDFKKYIFITSEDSLDYYVKAMNIKTIKIDENEIANFDKEKFDKKFEDIKDIKDIVFLYDKDSKIEQFSHIIDTYNMRTINIISYKFDMNISSIYEHNYKAISKLSKIE